MGRRRRSRTIAASAAATALLATSAASGQLPLTEPAPTKARIVFVADFGVHTIAADGSDRRRLTTRGESTVDEEPVFSPDGSTVAFSRFDLHEDPSLIWLVGSDGANPRPLTTERRNSHDSSPTWSADGTRVAFARLTPGRDRVVASIVSVAATGGDERTIHREATTYEDAAFFGKPAWSPSGDRVLFSREVLAGNRASDYRPSLHVVPAAGGPATRIATNGDDGAWAPGGDRIAYLVMHDERTDRPCLELCDGGDEVYVVNADGTGRTRVTRTTADEGSPTWSGDGRHIAFDSDRNTGQSELEESPPELYSIRPDGSCLTWLTNGTAHSRSPDFERGATLSSDAGGCGAVPREPLVETDSGKAEAFRRFPVWWLGRVAQNGLLLTDVEVRSRSVWFGYHDCGRFDPAECGTFVNVSTRDLCSSRKPLPHAGRRGNPLSQFRGGLLHVAGDDEIGFSDLYSGRSRIVLDTASGHPVDPGVLTLLARVDGEVGPGGTMPAAALPSSYWRTLTSVTAAHRRLGSVRAAARALRLSTTEVRRRLAAARRLDQLGVERRLGCPG